MPVRDSMERSLEEYDTAASVASRAIAAQKLAEVVRAHLRASRPNIITDDDELFSELDKVDAMDVTKHCPFTYDGIRFNNALNAFQAQKAPVEERDAFGPVDYLTASQMGRQCKIDVVEWDANRYDLMKEILSAQVQECECVRDKLVLVTQCPADGEIRDKSPLAEPFWKKALPQIWQEIADEYFAEDDGSEIAAALPAPEATTKPPPAAETTADESSGGRKKKRMRPA